MTVIASLAQTLREKDERDFRLGIEMTDIMSVAAQRIAMKRGMRKAEIFKAIMTALVSYVQFLAPEDQWEDVGDTLANELKARLTVRQVN